MAIIRMERLYVLLDESVVPQDGEVVAWNATAKAFEHRAGGIGTVGPQGPQGERGPQGLPGNDGATGGVGPETTAVTTCKAGSMFLVTKVA